MRKAFDANVPKLKPRLKGAAPAATLALEEAVDEAPRSVRVPFAPPAPAAEVARVAEPAAARPAASPQPSASAHGEARSGATGSPLTPATTVHRSADDLEARRARLDKIKQRVADAARPAARVEPPPADPARAAERVLGLARDLEAELGRSREREEALRADL
ncbi:MAG TPA: hypothetical protein VFP50_13925, partial [Anaeromyxobacteraceae bacterium]|nr:hypothetical protein [Anaeromyxobacteraceae bacterium]